MPNESEFENINAKSLRNENSAQARVTVLTVASSVSDGSTAELGKADYKCYVPPCGLVFYVMAFFGFLSAFAMNAGLSVAIVAMVNQTAISEDVVTTNNSDTDGQCPRDPALRNGSGEFIWDRNQQGAVLASYFYGRQLTQV